MSHMIGRWRVRDSETKQSRRLTAAAQWPIGSVRRSLLLLFVAAVPVAVVATESQPMPGLQGSKHDFSSEEWTGGDSCIACHADRREDFPAEAPLWNPSAEFNRTFGDAVQDRDGRLSLPGDGTMICMRCHDGTMAKDMFGGLAPPSSANKRHPAILTTGHGRTNHPVGVAYPAFDRDFRPLNAVLSEGKVLLPDGRIECISCHDPHNVA
jgi:hypothetical protein